MRCLTKKFVMTFHNMRMLSCSSKNTINAKYFTKCLSVVEGKATLLVNDERVRRPPDIDPDVVKYGTRLFLGPVCQRAN